MARVYVLGVGMTQFGRHPETTVKALTREATLAALADAAIPAARIDAAFFGNVCQSPLEGQYAVGGQIALRDMGFERTPIVNCENACASATTALSLAVSHVLAGQGEVALAVGVDKMSHPDRRRSFQVFEGAWDVTAADETVARLRALAEGVQTPPEYAGGAEQRSLFMDVYASLAKYHMKRFGTTMRQLAAIASKNHFHSTLNPLSQYREPYSIEQVMNGRLIVWPLTVPMCAPISDGAAAAIVCSEAVLARLGRARAVPIRACVVSGGTDRDPTELDRQIGRIAALRAYEAAGVGPEAMSVAEVHDATAFAEVQQSENLGFCEYGQGGWIAERGETTLGGRIPINTSGGLESKGHPIGASGLGQIHELVTQLRGEAGPRQVERARFAIAENGGGFYRCEEAVVCTTILEAPAA